MEGHLWVEPQQDLIIARIRGTPTKELIEECQRKVLILLKDTELNRILYDSLEMENPTVDIAVHQQALEAQYQSVRLRRAIVVPNTKIAFLSRLAFGDGEYRVFYNDMSAAIRWLAESG